MHGHRDLLPNACHNLHSFLAVNLWPLSEDGPVCSNGVSGVGSTDGTICCSSECDECSEDACSLSVSFGVNSENECCSSDIAVSGELCDSTGMAPCIISEGLIKSNDVLLHNLRI